MKNNLYDADNSNLTDMKETIFFVLPVYMGEERYFCIGYTKTTEPRSHSQNLHKTYPGFRQNTWVPNL